MPSQNDIPLYLQKIASNTPVTQGNRTDSIAHVTGSGIIPRLMGTAGKIFVDDPANMNAPVMAHELTHLAQQKAGSFQPGLENYNFGGTAGLNRIGGNISKLNAEQQAEIPADYMSLMGSAAKMKNITPDVLQQADAANSAFARPIQQLANMANPSTTTINTTPEPPGPPPAALTGMIKPLSQVGGKTLYSQGIPKLGAQ